MKKCVLIIAGLDDDTLYKILLFDNIADREKAREIMDIASDEWIENALECFIYNFDSLDDDIKPMYEHLKNINSIYEYQFYCLENSGIKYDTISKNSIDIYYN